MKKHTQPNILFIPIDDLRPQLCCYGQDQMITPHIDALADTGTLFHRPYCQVPVCGASRASLLSGLRPLRDRFVSYDTWTENDAPDICTLPQHFRENGYTTVSNGKVFHHRPDCADRSWSEEPWHPFSHYTGTWRNYLNEKNRKLDNSKEHRGPAYECMDVIDNAYFDGQIADKTVEDIRRLARQDTPFFLAAGFVKPHLPFNAPKKYWDYYDFAKIECAKNPFKPENAPDEAMHHWGELRQYFDIPGNGRPLSEEMSRHLIHGYYAATSYVDAQVGKIIAELDAAGVRDNTIIILWGDHGWQLGEHGLWCKHCNFNTSLWAPLIVNTPWASERNECNALVEFVDIYPSLCELAQIPVPEHAEGVSFTSLLDSPNQNWKNAAFSRYESGESVRTNEYLYTEWTNDDGEMTARMLYDHRVDPEENCNIAEKPEMADDVAALHSILEKGWADKGIMPV